MRHEKVVFDSINRLDVEVSNIVGDKVLVPLEEESDSVIDLWHIDSLFSIIKSKILFVEFLFIDDGSSDRVNI